jgi:REP element-mobilizing transposase RayT
VLRLYKKNNQQKKPKTMPIEKFSSAERLFQNQYRIPSARAMWHDYNGGIYFVTICTRNHFRYFGNIVDGVMQLSDIGIFAVENLQNIGNHYPYAEIPLFVVMPNHIHVIVFVDGDRVPYQRRCDVHQQQPGCCRDGARPVSTDNGIDKNIGNNEKMQQIDKRKGWLSIVIGGFKSAITKFANHHRIDFMWQTRFHDRIIRSQDELNRIAEYIENNPINWDNDCFNK